MADPTCIVEPARMADLAFMVDTACMVYPASMVDPVCMDDPACMVKPPYTVDTACVTSMFGRPDYMIGQPAWLASLRD